MFAVVTGMNVIKGVIVPSVDKLERNAVLKAFGMLPGGNTVKNVSDILLGSGMVLKMLSELRARSSYCWQCFCRLPRSR